jgi:lincosamide nucleotidyltransferase A/C/D/E
MTADDVLHVVRIVDAAGVAVWLDGGWGIDALLGAQFRLHEDLDVVVRLTDVDAMTAALDVFGYVVVEDELPTRLVLRTSTGLQLDVHPVTFDATGTAWQAGALPDGGDCEYPSDGFVDGTVAGTTVGCLSAEVQLAHHLGYPPRSHDHEDMERLAHHLGLALPPPYAP